MRRALVVWSLCWGLVAAGCAARPPMMPPEPATPRHPEFHYPVTPQGTDEIQNTRIERGWRYLQADNARTAFNGLSRNEQRRLMTFLHSL